MARILVLEEKDELRAAYARALEKDGHEIFQAATIEEAGDVLDCGDLDFVILNIGHRPPYKAHELMRIFLRHARAQILINPGPSAHEAHSGPAEQETLNLADLRNRIRALLTPSRASLPVS